MTREEKIKHGENRFIEFKLVLPESDTFCKSDIAFANGAGGEIL